MRIERDELETGDSEEFSFGEIRRVQREGLGFGDEGLGLLVSKNQNRKSPAMKDEDKGSRVSAPNP